ncbi:MAG: DNA methyltransferase, partial [Betaproteobacteria bacterium RIFCSPLOWO2_12_FULL_62_13]
LLPQVQGNPGPKNADLRQALLKLIGDFANWDLASNATYLEVSRGLGRAAHPEETPLVVDPFAGGGSIPLEALRLGCDAFASDLNPVACLILKVMLEDIPRHGPALAEELRKAGAEIKKQVEKELAQFYPPDSDGARPIAYLWARTVRCESPDCGAEIPLVRSFWLSRKASRRRALRPKVVRPHGGTPHVEFEIFEPASEEDVPKGTVSRAKALCLCCKVRGRNSVLVPDRVRAQLVAQRGGADVEFDAKGNRTGGALMLAVVTVGGREGGRAFRPVSESDYAPVWQVSLRVRQLSDERKSASSVEVSPFPDERLPERNTLGLRVPGYGVREWADLFSRRQLFALRILAQAVHRTRDSEVTRNLTPALALAVSRTADYCSANCSLHAGRDVVRNTWARNALPIVWDFYEIAPLGEGSGCFDGALDWIARVADSVGSVRGQTGSVQQADALESPLPDDSVAVWFTDPPYYDAIGYAESSDFFLVWLKRMLPLGDASLFGPSEAKVASPKIREIIQDDTFLPVYGVKKGARFFEEKISAAFAEGRRVITERGIASVVFAHKTTEGWEALLGGLLRAGWVVTGSWPIRTEMENKVSGSQGGDKKAMLLSSVHLVCRPRTSEDVGDWGEVLRALPKRVTEWMQRLQAEHVRGADLVFACIGPALEIFSRYAKVETAEGREVSLVEYLEKVWEVVGRAALEQVLGDAGGAGALEEDARLTALFLWTLQSSNSVVAEGGDDTEDEERDEDHEDDGPKKKKAGGYSLVFDVARRFAQPLGIRLPEWEGRIIETEKGVVRLLPVSERAKQLFGEDGARTVAAQFERNPVAAAQLALFPDDPETAPQVKGRGRKKANTTSSSEPPAARREATTLDRVHAAMLLQRSGQTNALRALLQAEQERGADFLRLANALSALYPRESEEKRLLDAMLLAAPR